MRRGLWGESHLSSLKRTPGDGPQQPRQLSERPFACSSVNPHKQEDMKQWIIVYVPTPSNMCFLDVFGGVCFVASNNHLLECPARSTNTFRKPVVPGEDPKDLKVNQRTFETKLLRRRYLDKTQWVGTSPSPSFKNTRHLGRSKNSNTRTLNELFFPNGHFHIRRSKKKTESIPKCVFWGAKLMTQAPWLARGSFRGSSSDEVDWPLSIGRDLVHWSKT